MHSHSSEQIDNGPRPNKMQDFDYEAKQDGGGMLFPEKQMFSFIPFERLKRHEEWVVYLTGIFFKVFFCIGDDLSSLRPSICCRGFINGAAEDLWYSCVSLRKSTFC